MHQRRKEQLQLIQTSTQFASDRQGKQGQANMQVYGADKVWHQALVLAVAADWDNELLDLGEVGHFNQALGYREWPKAELLIARLDG